MKVFNLKSLLLSSLLIIAVSFSVSGQDAMKSYSETFGISKGATLISDTHYSDVEVIAWDRDEVDVVAEVEVNASSKSKAEEKLEKIEIEITKSGNNVSIETDLVDGWSRNAKVEIRIVVQAPSYINLNVENRYGDLYIQEVSGLVLLDLAYSNLKADQLSRGTDKPYNSVELAYSNGVIGEVGILEAELAYSDLEIGSCKKIYSENHYSKLMAEKVGGIVTEGRYDKYFVDEIDSFEGELKYSGIKFGTLNKSLNLESGYTNVKIERLANGFSELDAQLSYGNIFVGVDDGNAFKFDGEAKYGKVQIADANTMNKLSKKREGTYMRIWGNVGSNPKSSMHLVTRYGNIHIE